MIKKSNFLYLCVVLLSSKFNYPYQSHIETDLKSTFSHTFVYSRGKTTHDTRAYTQLARVDMSKGIAILGVQNNNAIG